jgi:glutamate-5-semialdehyde dehydrogenase
MTGAIVKKLNQVRDSAKALRSAETQRKNQVLTDVAGLLRRETPSILRANEKDLSRLGKSATSAFRDRLMLTAPRLEQMAVSLEQVAALQDPVGEVVDRKTLPNGLKLRRVRSPLGVIFMIFESRPNVAVEAFSLAFKSGNAIILRGGSESMGSTGILYKLIRQALEKNGFPEFCVWGITDGDRKIPQALLKERHWIDVVVPRGGDKLIEYVVKNSEIPIIKNDRGLCHVYVHEDANLDMALEIIVNAKTQRPGVCNAAETLLVHQKVAAVFLPKAWQAMEPHGVEWFGCPKTAAILGKKKIRAAKPVNWDTEYLDLKLNCKVIDSLDSAIAHIETHGSRHSEAIVTASSESATRFENEIDAAAVYWNASTRFTDGFEFGLGGELGISTQKLHVRGPVGLRELTSLRWIGDGSGQVRR